ncbi:MAG: DNA topoisomerase IB [Candidatus Eisenbacteria bacterium]|nr:DNA topoisomerase IB [Candidatus Eisenbacteria bacterium]
MSTAGLSLRAHLQLTGIRRLGSPRNGYRYRRASGAPVAHREHARLATLRIPPSWRDVAIAPAATAKLQAVGRDSAGRWQYVYRKAHAARRANTKFRRLLAFARALPQLRTAIRRDLSLPGMPRDRACAIAALLLLALPLRSGGQRYARENGTFGIATLRPHHLRVRGERMLFAFRGKHGIRQTHALRSRRLARLLRQLQDMGGRELFQYHNARGRPCDLRNSQLNGWLRGACGTRVTAKDFRTWGATLLCAGLLAQSREPRSERATRAALAASARWLGNTPQITRDSYVHPQVFAAFRDGRTVSVALTRPQQLVERLPNGLHPAERALVRLLSAASPRRN